MAGLGALLAAYSMAGFCMRECDVLVGLWGMQMPLWCLVPWHILWQCMQTVRMASQVLPFAQN